MLGECPARPYRGAGASYDTAASFGACPSSERTTGPGQALSDMRTLHTKLRLQRSGLARRPIFFVLRSLFFACKEAAAVKPPKMRPPPCPATVLHSSYDSRPPDQDQDHQQSENPQIRIKNRRDPARSAVTGSLLLFLLPSNIRTPSRLKIFKWGGENKSGVTDGRLRN